MCSCFSLCALQKWPKASALQSQGGRAEGTQQGSSLQWEAFQALSKGVAEGQLVGMLMSRAPSP